MLALLSGSVNSVDRVPIVITTTIITTTTIILLIITSTIAIPTYRAPVISPITLHQTGPSLFILLHILLHILLLDQIPLIILIRPLIPHNPPEHPHIPLQHPSRLNSRHKAPLVLVIVLQQPRVLHLVLLLLLFDL